MNVIADRVNISVTSGDHIQCLKATKDLLGSMGAHFERDNLMRLNDGTLMIFERSRFTSFQTSGQLLQELRSQNLLDHFLFNFANWTIPKVSMLHIAGDWLEHASPVLKRLHKRGKDGDLGMTRKKVHPKNVRFLDRYCHYDPGVKTGSLMLGSPKAEAQCLVYDKRNEFLDKDKPDPGPWLRAEFRGTDKLGITLRDVVNPEPCYRYFMGQIMGIPQQAPLWAPDDNEFRLDPPAPLDAYALLQRRVETSPDLADLLRIADDLGPNGETLLLRLIRDRHNTLSNPSAPVAASSGT